MFLGHNIKSVTITQGDEVLYSADSSAKTPEIKKDEEWIWVEGFKGMNKDMTCRKMQYDVGKTYTYDGDVELCEAGYHLSTTLKGCLQFYTINEGNRFFRVKALVKKKDFTYADRGVKEGYPLRDKLVSKVIIIGEELTTAEIFSSTGYGEKLGHEKYYELAREVGIDSAYEVCLKDKLVDSGYSETFAKLLSRNYNRNTCERAIAIASLPDLSMDMKCWIIFK